MTTLRPCLECGELSPWSRCAEHARSREARGYDDRWQRLSRKVRQLQPFCSDCGSTEDLTADHTPEAWRRKARGLPIRLKDIAVVCRSCNSKRGAAR